MIPKRLIGERGYTPTVGRLFDQPNAAGSEAGAAVTVSFATAFQDQFGNGLLPPSYTVTVAPNQACFVSVTNKTSSGFDVVLTPTASNVTLAAGSFDALIHS